MKVIPQIQHYFPYLIQTSRHQVHTSFMTSVEIFNIQKGGRKRNAILARVHKIRNLDIIEIYFRSFIF